ncbi:MAG: hypothetical protein M0Z59_05760 [Nitrospiraceae bacterium]|nr:hypothetical protein [Nitrospiraceae bacterium]
MPNTTFSEEFLRRQAQSLAYHSGAKGKRRDGARLAFCNTIASILGHSQLSTTRRYVKHNTESMRNGLNILDRLDRVRHG